MTKLLKILAYTIGSLIEWILILVVLLAFALRVPSVQTYFAAQATTYLSSELGAEVKINKVHFIFFDKVALDGILLRDQQGDTLIYSDRILVTIDEYNFGKKEYTIGASEIKNAFVHIQRSKDNVFNHSFLTEYFARDKKKKNTIAFKFYETFFSDCRFKFDDHRKPHRASGIDYFHLNAAKINGSIQGIKIEKNVITGHVNHLNLKEQCGFELKEFQSNVQVSPSGVLLSDLELWSNESYVRSSKLNMLSDRYTCFKSFVDSVTFDAKIDESSLSLKEIAFFALPLEGMNDRVRLSTEIHQKVSDLKLKNLDLQFKKKSRIQGTFELNDYRNFMKGHFDEKLNYAFLDFNELKTLRLPNRSEIRYIELTPELQAINHLEIKHASAKGTFNQFEIASNTLSTSLGEVTIKNGLLFTKNEEQNSYLFRPNRMNENDVHIDDFKLGTLINVEEFGILNGRFLLEGEINSNYDLILSTLNGEISRFDYLDYKYSDIRIDQGSFANEVFNGYLSVMDDNLQLTCKGFIDLKENKHLKFTLDVREAELENINMTSSNFKLLSKAEFDLYGDNPNNFDGNVQLNGLQIETNGELLSVDHLKLQIDRTPYADLFSIKSSLGSANIQGKINFKHLKDDLNYQLSRVFPALFDEVQDKYNHHGQDHFKYNLSLLDANALVKIIYPKLSVAPKLELYGHYFGEKSNFNMVLKSEHIDYEKFRFENIILNQFMDSTSTIATYHANEFSIGDSIQIKDLNFKSTGGDNYLNHDLSWEQGTHPTSHVTWETTINGPNVFEIVLNPSSFFIDDKKWNIARKSEFNFEENKLAIDTFELKRNDQYISIFGEISDNEIDKLNFKISDLRLGEISNFISTDYPMNGRINAVGFIANPFNDLNFKANGQLTQFHVKEQKVGNIAIQAEWDKTKQAISTNGDLTYIEEKTFDFTGDYYIFEKDNNLNFDLNFDNTDIQFTNAFMDPKVLSEIRGMLFGKIDLGGTFTHPILDGTIDLKGGSMFMDILGVHLGVDGPINVDKDGFYIDDVPVFDEDGNSGKVIGTVHHNNFQDFNFNLQLDLESLSNSNSSFGSNAANKFLVMNLPYSPDVSYYGKGYATGSATILGYTNNLSINVDFKTEEETTINIPMYGIGEIEDEGFITFANNIADSSLISTPPKFDFTGVDLDLNFEVTPAADINIIFNEDLGDIIHAKGFGNIGISLDNLGDVKMEGVYTVDRGAYDFAMNPISKNAIAIKQKFIIEEGGSIRWMGNPYDPDLNLRTYYTVNTNIAEISNDQFGSGSGAHQTIRSFLELTGSMTSPTIGFDIQATESNESAKALLNRIKSDPDELNRQFFSLMLFRRFQPIDADQESGTGALGLITNQINYMLSSVLSEYNLNLDYDADQITGDNTLEFGMSKSFLDDRLIVSGSFGIETYGDNANITDANGNEIVGQLVGDMKIEYLLNESGSFRVNIFNESTDKTVIQEVDLAPFTQGAGLHYKEDFNSFKDFKLIQYLLDIFRQKGNKRYPNKGNHQQRLVPNTNSPN